MSIEGYKRPARPPVPFKERFRAWWDGSGLDVPAAPAAVQRAPAAPDTLKHQNLLEPLAPWESPALRIAQLAWGEGYAKPGGAEYILELAKPIGIDPAMSVMEFGAGLGGGARAIHRKFGAWVTGYEPDRDIAKAGRQLSVIHVWPVVVDAVVFFSKFSRCERSSDVIRIIAEMHKVFEHFAETSRVSVVIDEYHEGENKYFPLLSRFGLKRADQSIWIKIRVTGG